MAVNTQKINVKAIAKYALLPGIVPRAKELGNSGFGYLAFLFALVYRSVRILPNTHPYVDPDNIGKFGLIQVISAAANNLVFDRKHADQILVFAALMIGLVLMVLQFVLFLLAIFSGQAFAAAAGGGAFDSIFVTQYPQTDIAFMMLDYVFGIPSAAGGGSFFGSNALAGGPTAFHQGLHALINFYNLAILLVAVIIFLYYVVVVVIETAQTGVPFGRRFAKLYAPFRLIFAVGLLVPLNYGFNGAQYITLYAAKVGSSFATNGWIVYNRSIAENGQKGTGGTTGTAAKGGSNNPLGTPNTSLLAHPRSPSIDEILYFSSVYHACREIYGIYVPRNPQNPAEGTRCIQAYVIDKDGDAQLFAASPSEACEGNTPDSDAGPYTYETAKTEFGNSNLEVVLGEWDPTTWTADPGGVHPFCGKITISLANDNPAVWQNNSATTEHSDPSAGIRAIEKDYYGGVQQLLRDSAGSLSAFGERAAHSFIPTSDATHSTCWKSGVLNDREDCDHSWSPPATAMADQLATYRTATEVVINAAYGTIAGGLNIALNDEMMRRGWGGAGIWYNHIADINGTYTSAVYAVPSVKQYPEVMEKVKDARQAQNKDATPCGIFDPNLGDGSSPVRFDNNTDKEVEDALNHAYTYFACEKVAQQTGTPRATTATPGGGTIDTMSTVCNDDADPANAATVSRANTNNPVVDAIGVIFGINGLFDLRKASCVSPDTGQSKIHPLAQLSALGRSLIENSIRNMGMAVGAAFGGGIFGILSNSLGAAIQTASGMFISIALIGLVAGFTLYYVLPFLPFIYFFFAVGSWVKSIFEAMVGVPLWALAHLRIDGEGLPGRSAIVGYFLIFEIFLRPIVIVFGLIGGVAIFSAMTIMLNNIFDMVVLNTGGINPGDVAGTLTATGGTEITYGRSMLDKFFYTIIYTILMYIMATASFKMIDTVPANIMRWINTGVSTFNDNKGDPAQNLTTYVATGGFKVAEPLLGSVRQGAAGLGDTVRAAANMTSTNPNPGPGRQG